MSVPPGELLDRFAAGDRHDFLSSVARTLTAIADGNSGLLEPLRNRVNAERRVIRLERARTQLETWLVATGGSFTVTVRRRAEWQACVVLSYKEAQWVVTRYGHTEAGALELALSGAASESGPWVEYLDKGGAAPYAPRRRQWHPRRAPAAPLSASAPELSTPPARQAAPTLVTPERRARATCRPPSGLGADSMFANNPFAVLWTADLNEHDPSASTSVDEC